MEPELNVHVTVLANAVYPFFFSQPPRILLLLYKQHKSTGRLPWQKAHHDVPISSCSGGSCQAVSVRSCTDYRRVPYSTVYRDTKCLSIPFEHAHLLLQLQ